MLILILGKILFGGDVPETTPLKDGIDFDYEHGFGEFALEEDHGEVGNPT